jgi:hypothetical protein
VRLRTAGFTGMEFYTTTVDQFYLLEIGKRIILSGISDKHPQAD